MRSRGWLSVRRAMAPFAWLRRMSQGDTPHGRALASLHASLRRRAAAWSLSRNGETSAALLERAAAWSEQEGKTRERRFLTAVSGLQPDQEYQVWLVASPAAPYGEKQPLAKFTTNVSGAQVAQAVGPLRQVVRGAGAERRFPLVTKANSVEPVLTQEPGRLARQP